MSERCGVQLMTIHKAKGLGFDVVIVPALERSTGKNDSPLVTMLERAHRAADAGEEADQLLVAPLGAQGSKHPTYTWIQGERLQREAEERKRLFYVACTRARRRLHLLGTATVSAQGTLRAGDHSGSLLACAWPALQPFFEAQRQAGAGRAAVEATQQQGPLLVAPPPPHPGLLRRLAAKAHVPGEEADSPAAAEDSLRVMRVPAAFQPCMADEHAPAAVTYASRLPADTPEAVTRLVRPQGSFEQRARGSAIHAMLELVAEEWNGSERPQLSELSTRLARLARGMLREQGLAPARVASIGASLVPLVLRAAEHPSGRWVLGTHPQARSEWSITTLDPTGAQISLRIDRSFRAGSTPDSEGTDYLWIIDYKTGAEPGSIALDAYLEGEKEQWRPQLERYGEALRAFYGADTPALRYALFFPELLALKTWGEQP